MGNDLHTLQNNYWQVGILPETGASIAFGRVHKGDAWVDMLRSTPEADYDNSSNCSSFVMLPWCNRIKDGILRFDGQEYQLRTTKDDGTARHGDVRGRIWQVDEADETHIRMSLQSGDFPDMNWPFKFSAVAEYELEDDHFTWTLALRNEDTRAMPGGFGHHPYFVRPSGEQPSVQISCNKQFNLVNFMAVSTPVPITPELDFRQLRALDDRELNDLLTEAFNHESDSRAEIVFPESNIDIKMYAETLFEHMLIYAPAGKPFFAVEPMTNASDGFNLYAHALPGSGVFVLQPGQEKKGTVILEATEPG
jgi:aldose 1-epimerase